MDHVLRTEMELGYFRWLERPGEDLGVLDNEGEYEECRSRVHCNCSHWSMGLKTVYDQEEGRYVADTSGAEKALEQLNSPSEGRHHVIVSGGDHNNVYFPDFVKYKKTLPECLMQGINGEYLELHDPLINDKEGVPMPAIDDETLISVNSELMGTQAKALKNSQYVKAYVLGAEELYPEYFGLGYGDFRPASWKHFEAWCGRNGYQTPKKEQVIAEAMSPERMLWLQFREQAMADRCGNYYKAILDQDEGHLIFYPTHGSAMCRDNRARLGQQPGTLLCQCDGMEMGHIMVENDEERRNVILISHFSSFGAPVIVPRLGNKRVDLSAVGGGRSFSAAMLRRLVYECLGMGVSKIFPIHWTSRLHDGEWFIKDTEAEAECRKVFDEITSAAPYLAGMGRLQPQAGILAGNAEWINGWKPQWTGFMQDALKEHLHMTLISDEIVDAQLAVRMPVLLVADNSVVMRSTMDALHEYAQAGGRIVLWGDFALQDEWQIRYKDEERQRLTQHKNVRMVSEPGGRERIAREFFLAGPEYGVFAERFRYREIPFGTIYDLFKEMEGAVLKPFQVEGENTDDMSIYPLTDRRSLLAVCINNGENEIHFSIRPDERLLKDAVCYDVGGSRFCDGEIRLQGGGTKLLWFCPGHVKENYEEKLVEAEDGFDRWKKLGADVMPYRYLYSHMRTGSSRDKRAVLTDVMLDTLAISTDCAVEGGKLRISFKVYDISGEPVKNAGVSFRLTPGELKWFRAEETEDGYQYVMEEKELPVRYDMGRKEYVQLKGSLRMIVRAEKDGKQGGAIVMASV